MDAQNAEQLDKLRHSAAHLLAAAVKELWPGTQDVYKRQYIHRLIRNLVNSQGCLDILVKQLS